MKRFRPPRARADDVPCCPTSKPSVRIDIACGMRGIEAVGNGSGRLLRDRKGEGMIVVEDVQDDNARGI